MERTVITPASFDGVALDELKAWLGISRTGEDALLTDLLAASAAMCEAFTGQTSIEQTVEETVPALPTPQPLSTRPIQSIASAESVSSDGTRSPLDLAELDIEFDPNRAMCIAPIASVDAKSIALTVRAGLAPDWTSLPKPLKQGIIRLAAFHYRDRESGDGGPPPASVAALWRPWRVMRLA
ncbi:MAG: hypothetical protein AAF553_00125 [Pseudomonadota bacterium]